MAKPAHIIGTIIVSLIIVLILGWWMESRKNEAPEGVLLENETTLDAPLTVEELEVNKPKITNDMNRLATLKTNHGDIVIELFEDAMPITTANFIKLAEEGFYDDVKFHRVIDNFMVQTGDPNSKGDDVTRYGTGGPGFTIQDEFASGEYLTNVRGTVAMANTGQPNSGGSQFFINTVDNTGLDFNKEPLTSKHPVFGRVIEGMDVVDDISSVETGERDVPIEPIIIESIEITGQVEESSDETTDSDTGEETTENGIDQ